MWNNKYSEDYREFTNTQSESVPSKIDIIVRAFTPGTKTVTLNIKTTIDNITLETSETIEIFVPEYIFTVFKRDGANDKEGTYALPQTAERGDKILDIGHLAWKVEVYQNQLNNFTNSNRANQIWGLGPRYTHPNHDQNVDNVLYRFMDNNKNVSPLPEINISVAGNLYKNGNQGVERVRFGFTDTKDNSNNITQSALQKAQAVLNNTNDILNNPQNCFYKMPEFNCVDQVVSSMQVGNFSPPASEIYNGDYKLKFRWDTPQGNSYSKEFKMRLSVPQKFIKHYNK
jgi:hypothetical protein